MLRSIGVLRVGFVGALVCGGLVVASVAQGQDDLFDDDLSAETGADDFGGDDLAATDQAAAQNEQMQQRFQEAMTALQESNWGTALPIFLELNQMAPGSPLVQLGIGICYYETGSIDLAISSLQMALVSRGAAQEPGLVENANVYLGQAYLKKGRYREAQRSTSNARLANPMNPLANMLYGKATLRQALSSGFGGGMDQTSQSEMSQAVEVLTQAIEQKSDYGDAYLERGRALTRLRQIRYAVNDLTRATQLLGATSEAAADLAAAYSLRAGQKAQKINASSAAIVADYRAAVDAATGYLANAPLGTQVAPWETTDPLTQTPERVLLSRADAMISLADELNNDESTSLYQASIEDAERIIALEDAADVDLASAYFNQGVCHRMLNDLPSAVTAFTKAIRIYKTLGASYSEAHLRRGICYYYQSRLDLALQDFDAASANPSNPFGYEPRAMFWAGLTFAERKEFATAVRHYTRAISAAPQYTRAYFNRGLAYLKMGRYDQALEDFDDVLRQVPDYDNADSYRELASKNLR